MLKNATFHSIVFFTITLGIIGCYDQSDELPAPRTNTQGYALIRFNFSELLKDHNQKISGYFHNLSSLDSVYFVVKGRNPETSVFRTKPGSVTYVLSVDNGNFGKKQKFTGTFVIKHVPKAGKVYVKVSPQTSFRVDYKIHSDQLDSALVAYLPVNFPPIDNSLFLNSPLVFGMDYSADRFGNPKSALYFSNIYSGAVLPTEENLQFDAQKMSYSVALWFYNSIEHRVDLISSYDVTTNAQKHFPIQLLMDPKENEIRFYISDKFSKNAAGHNFCAAKVQDISGRWIFVAAIYDFDRKLMQLYVDGVLQSEETIAFQYSTKSYFPIIIGGLKKSGSVFSRRLYLGKMDDIRFYRRALSDKEVAMLYREGTTLDLSAPSPQVNR
jgi:hypothetical protein